MRIGIFTNRTPSAKTSGASLHLLGVCQALAQRGHHVDYVLCGDLIDEYHVGATADELRPCFRRRSSIEIHPIRLSAPSPRRLLADHLSVSLNPHRYYDRAFGVAELRQAALKRLAELQLDSILAFDFGHIAAIRDIPMARKVAFPGDPLDLLAESRYRLSPVLNWKGRTMAWLNWRMHRSFWDWLVASVSGYQRVVWQAAHHAAQLQARGVPTEYIPTPIPDLSGGRMRHESTESEGRRLRVLHLGHLGGTAATLSLGVIKDHILPALRARFPGAFELHFIGRVDTTPAFLKGLEGPEVFYRGFVDDIDDEILTTDVFLAPMPHPVGSRTRILTALPYGVCVVAHASAALGNPELVSQNAVLFGGSGEELARLVVRALEDTALRQRAGEAARRAWRNFFSVETAGQRWAGAIEGNEAVEARIESRGLSPYCG